MSRTKHHDRQVAKLFGLAATVLLVGTASLAQAQTNYSLYWNVSGPAAWSNAANWTSTPGAYPYYATIIDNGGTATIAAGDSVTDNSSSFGSINGVVYIGGSSSALGGVGGNGNGYVNMSGGTVSITPGIFLQEMLGVASGSGIFTQSGGVNVPFLDEQPSTHAPLNFSSLSLGASNGGYGEYQMSGGSVGVNLICVGGHVDSVYVGGYQNAGTGVFNQTGGSVGAYGSSGFGGSSNYAVGLAVGGNWLGSTVGKGLYNTSVGTYTLGSTTGAGSPLFVGGCELVGGSGTGTFTQNCGTNAIVGGGQGIYQPGQATVPYNNAIGGLFLGWYAEPTGRASAYYGNGVGTYNLNAGLLTGGPHGVNSAGAVQGYEVVGVGGTGIFNQSGGTNLASFELDVGGTPHVDILFNPSYPNANGSYTLSGGLLMVPTPSAGQAGGAECVGTAGTGVFTQTGGTNLAPQLVLAGAAYSNSSLNQHVPTPGTYNLNGGLFQTNSIILGNGPNGVIGPATFNFTAGTLQAGAQGLNNSMPITVGTAASNVATVDANGQTAILNGENSSSTGILAGPGQLKVIDSGGNGTVVLGGSDFNGNLINGNAYAGGTTVLSGTLELVNSVALPSTSILTVGGPAAVVLSDQAGTMFGSDALGATDHASMVPVASAMGVVGVPTPDEALAEPVALSVVAGGVGLVPAAGGPAAVPEPSTLALLGAGLLSLLSLVGRRKTG